MIIRVIPNKPFSIVLPHKLNFKRSILGPLKCISWNENENEYKYTFVCFSCDVNQNQKCFYVKFSLHDNVDLLVLIEIYDNKWKNVNDIQHTGISIRTFDNKQVEVGRQIYEDDYYYCYVGQNVIYIKNYSQDLYCVTLSGDSYYEFLDQYKNCMFSTRTSYDEYVYWVLKPNEMIYASVYSSLYFKLEKAVV